MDCGWVAPTKTLLEGSIPSDRPYFNFLTYQLKRKDQMVKIINNELPNRFITWCELFAYIKGRIQPDHKEIQYSEYGQNAVWEFTIDFIKARCFEEVVNLYPHEYTSDYGGPDWQWERLEAIRVFEKKTKLNAD